MQGVGINIRGNKYRKKDAIGGRKIHLPHKPCKNEQTIITSAYGKNKSGIVNWVNEGKLLYENKEKAPDYLRILAPIASTINNQGLETEASTNKYTKNPAEKAENSEKIHKNTHFEEEKPLNSTETRSPEGN